MNKEFECDKCGACCKTFPIFASEDDAIREPRILSEGLRLDDSISDKEWRFKLYPLPFHHRCCFLGEHNLCAIYENRPDVCRAFKAGSAQCQAARARRGLLPLVCQSL